VLRLKAAGFGDRRIAPAIGHEHLNVLLIGPTGVGKSFIASAIAHAACRADFSVRWRSTSRVAGPMARGWASSPRSW
jgi:DNA replication protein DnaC